MTPGLQSLLRDHEEAKRTLTQSLFVAGELMRRLIERMLQEVADEDTWNSLSEAEREQLARLGAEAAAVLACLSAFDGMAPSLAKPKWVM